MRKRLLGVLVGAVLLTALCMNVLAAYSDSFTNIQTEDTPVLTQENTSKDSTNAVSIKEEERQDIESEPSSTPFTDATFKPITINEISETNPEPQLIGPQLRVNGVSLQNTETTTLNDSTYISIRNLIEALDPTTSVSWENGQLLATGNNFYMTARPGDLYMVVNDRYLYVPNGILSQDGSILAPIRTICNALGATTNWDVMTKDISVTTSGAPLVSGNSHYNYDDLYWLSRIITAESRNQPLKGKIAVGTVIMNRVESPKFPDTIHDVIFSGIQFSPVQNGSIYNAPSEESVIAAKLVLDGAREAGDSLFFNRVGLNSWASRSKTYITTIADHNFYR